MTALTVEDRALAAYLGFAIGDALGATVEFMTKREIAAEYGVHREIKGGGWLRLKPGQVTDDTQMALALGSSLVRCGGLDLRDVCEEFAAWLKSGPIDVGNTCRRGIRRYIVHGTVEGTFAPGDAGNGAAMRVLPLALATFGEPSKAEAWALAHGRITHHHPLSDSACLALVQMVHILLGGQGKQETRKIADAVVEKHKGFRFDPYPGRCTPYVVDTMQTVLHFYFATNPLPTALFKPSIKAEMPIPPARWRACLPAPLTAWPRSPGAGLQGSTLRWPPQFAGRCQRCSRSQARQAIRHERARSRSPVSATQRFALQTRDHGHWAVKRSTGFGATGRKQVFGLG